MHLANTTPGPITAAYTTPNGIKTLSLYGPDRFKRLGIFLQSLERKAALQELPFFGIKTFVEEEMQFNSSLEKYSIEEITRDLQGLIDGFDEAADWVDFYTFAKGSWDWVDFYAPAEGSWCCEVCDCPSEFVN